MDDSQGLRWLKKNERKAFLAVRAGWKWFEEPLIVAPNCKTTVECFKNAAEKNDTETMKYHGF